jgi:HSP20 family protein
MTEASLERRADHAFDLVPRRFLDWLWASNSELTSELRIEEFGDDDQYVIRAEMPGLDPDKDIEVRVRDHSLEVSAERKQETKVEEGKTYRSEFSYGSFFRRIVLPPDADEGDVTATYRDGILEVRMPREAKQAEATKIPVSHG